MYKKTDVNPTNNQWLLKFLYKTFIGRMVLKLLTVPALSKIVGCYMNSSLSRGMIKGFIRKNNIDMSEYMDKSFKCYNDFFTRRIKKEKRPLSEGLISPCDAKLTAYKIKKNSVFNIKNSEYSVSEILQNAVLAKEFENGTCLVFRLCVDDYHRYCYFDDCTEGEYSFIGGILHTVQPIAFLSNKVFHRNCREYTVLYTDHFGKAVQIEVGALCVGKILNYHEKGKHQKGEEKGMFLFGGSTIILLINDVNIDPQITKNTNNGIETVVKMGEKIGEKTKGFPI